MFIAAPWTRWSPTYAISHWRSRSTWRVRTCTWRIFICADVSIYRSKQTLYHMYPNIKWPPPPSQLHFSASYLYKICLSVYNYKAVPPPFWRFCTEKKLSPYTGVNLVVYTKASCSLFCLHSSFKEEKPFGTSLFICVLSEIVELFDLVLEAWYFCAFIWLHICRI